MNNKLLAFPVVAIMSIGLVGCGMNDKETAVQDRNTNIGQPVGFYSNSNHKANTREQGGNARILDNNGPFAEWMTDGGLNDREQHYRRLQNNGFSRNDFNYHGHLGYNDRNPKSSYYVAYDGDFINQINRAAHVPSVRDVQSLVNGNDVLIALSVANEDDKEQAAANVRQAVKPYLKGKNVTIVTDSTTYNRIKSIDNDLKNGGPRDKIHLDVENIFYNLNNR